MWKIPESVRPNERTEIQDLQRKNADLITLVPREAGSSDRAWTTPLSDPDFHTRYLNKCDRFYESDPFIVQFLKWIKVYLEISAFNIKLQYCFSLFPDDHLAYDDAGFQKTLKCVRSNEQVYTNACPIEFLKKGEFLKLGTINSLRSHYDQDEPTVVLTIIGPPSHGKSTLLNGIAWYCSSSLDARNFFRADNTTEHTTKNSMVLSHPVYYHTTPMMLIDSEGLEGTEIQGDLAVQQRNLKAALLTLSSVPCIIIEGERSKLKFTDETIRQIARLQGDFGFCTERIYLFFYDKDIQTLITNQEYLDLVATLNSQYFQGREVIKIVCKPNFVARGKEADCELFLENLLQDCSLFVKKNADGSPVKIFDLLSKMKTILTYPDANLKELCLSSGDIQKRDLFIAKKTNELQDIFDNTISLSDQRLLPVFIEAKDRNFSLETDAEWDSLSYAVKHDCNIRLEFEVNRIKGKIIEIEACYRITRVLDKERLVEIIKNEVDYFHKTAFCFIDFNPKVEEMEEKLKRVMKHIRPSADKVRAAVVALNDRKSCCHKRSAWMLAGQVVLTVVTGGIGGAASASVTAARAGIALAQASRLLVTRIAAGVAIGAAVGFSGNFMGGVCTAFIFKEKAKEVVRLNKSPRVCSDQIQELIQSPSSSPVPVLLFMGSKDTLVSEFANSFAALMAPFTPIGFKVFAAEKYVQGLAFEYFHPRVGDLTTSYVLCLRMSNNPESANYPKMMQVARTLVEAATVTCLLVNNSDSYSRTFQSHILPPAIQSALNSSFIVVHESTSDITPIIDDFIRYQVKRKSAPMREFCKEEISVVMSDVKEEFDRMEPLQARRVLDQFKLLNTRV